jgi:hypothetical protein
MRDSRARGVALSGGKSPRLPQFLFLLLAIAVLLGARPASADTIDYVATSTYSATAPASPYSASNSDFTFTFSAPSTVADITQIIPVSLTFTLGDGSCCTFSGAGEVQFMPDALLGLFVVDFTAGGDTYTWDFYGPQIYSGTGPFTLDTGPPFAINSSPTLSQFFDSQGLYLDTVTGQPATFSDGTVTATPSTAPVPEPTSLLLLVTGMLSLGPLLRRFVRV